MGAKKLTEYDLVHFTLGQVAEMSGFSRKSIERFIREKKLKSEKIQGRRVIRKRWYCEFMGIEL